MPTARLADLRMLERALNSYGVLAEKAVVRGFRKAARFGHTALQYTYTRTRDPWKIRASGSYGQAFITQDIPEGALLANAMFYAVFVERGRRKGRPPPLEPILEWVYQKRLSARPKPLPKPRKPRKRKQKPSSPPPGREPGSTPETDPGTDPDGSNGKPPVYDHPKKPRKKYTKAEREARRRERRKKKAAKIRKERARKSALKKRFREHQKAIETATSIAQRVRWKIAKHGTKGRWVFRRTMPKIAKRAAREIRREITVLNKAPPTV